MSLVLLIFSLTMSFVFGCFDIPRPDFLTMDDLKEAYFYNSKSRAPKFVQEYWLCGEKKDTKIIDISCAPLDDDDVDGSKRGITYIEIKIKNKLHVIMPRNGDPRRDCVCQARFIKKILAAPTYCFLVQDRYINANHFFQKKTSWIFEKVKSEHGTVLWHHACNEKLK